MFSKTLKPVFFSLFIGVATLLSSCDHNDDHHDDPKPHEANSATITITNPTENGEVKSGQTIAITGTIVAKEVIHGYTVSIRRKADMANVFLKTIHDHATNVTINQTWEVPAVGDITEYELEIVATLDHDGNTATKKINFRVLP